MEEQRETTPPGGGKAPGGAPERDPQLRTPRPGSRFRVRLVLLTALLAGVAAAVAMVAMWISLRDPAVNHYEAGQHFLECIIAGELAAPGFEGRDSAPSGYAKAYDMLAEDVRRHLPFPDFCHGFALPAEEDGPIIGTEALRRRRSRRRARHVYRLVFGDPDATPGSLPPPKVLHLEVVLVLQGDRWVVADYALRPGETREIR